MSKVDKQVVGLYSFPKSGNTWLRAIIAGAVGIPKGPQMLQKYVTDTHYGKVMENPWNFNGTDWYFYKSHLKNLLTKHKDEEFKTDKILYIYRHPLDVFLSYLNFASNNVSPQVGAQIGLQFDKVEDLTEAQMEMLFSRYLLEGTLVPKNQEFGGVFEHIKNFEALKESGFPVHIMRYEDLTDDFVGTTQKMFEFLGMENIDTDEVFKDADSRTKQNGKFFWKRQKNNFENYLTPSQIDRFYLLYEKEMERLGYPR